MSKKELDFGKLDMKKKPEVIKSSTSLDTEKAIELIHNQSEEKERTKRVTIDLPFSLYVEIKKKIVEEEKTMKDYFIELADKNVINNSI